MIGQLSPKQMDFILDSDAFINLAEGSVRSGKSVAADWRWVEFCAGCPPHALLLLTGKTQDTVVRNVLIPMQQMFGRHRVNWSLGQNAHATIMGRQCAIVGANDKGAESRIRGATYWGWLADEITLHPQNFVEMALTRLSAPGAMAFWTCNPDSPYHWLMTDYLLNDERMSTGFIRRWHFTLDDNPYLTQRYIDMLKAMFSGLFYRRMILGEWVLAEGVIYDMFNADLHVIDSAAWLAARELEGFPRLFVSVDHGTSNPCVFGLWGQYRNQFHLVREWYWDSRARKKQKTDAEYAEAMGLWLSGAAEELGVPQIVPAAIWVDPSATGFIGALRKKGFKVLKAKNDVLAGISTVSTALSERRLTYDPSCHNCIREKAAYIWDETAQQRGEDKPLKTNDHCNDMERYGVFNETRTPSAGAVKMT